MSVQSQILTTPNNDIAPVSEQGLSIQPHYAPFDLLLIPYRDRLLHLSKQLHPHPKSADLL